MRRKRYQFEGLSEAKGISYGKGSCKPSGLAQSLNIDPSHSLSNAVVADIFLKVKGEKDPHNV